MSGGARHAQCTHSGHEAPPSGRSLFRGTSAAAASAAALATSGGKSVSEHARRRAATAAQIRYEHVVCPDGPLREIGDHVTSVSAGYPGPEQGSGTLSDPVGRGVKHAPDLPGIGEGVAGTLLTGSHCRGS